MSNRGVVWTMRSYRRTLPIAGYFSDLRQASVWSEFLGPSSQELTPPASDQTQEQEHKRDADEESEVVISSIVMYFVHLHGWVEE